MLTLGTDTAKQFLVDQVQIDSDVAFEELLLKPLRSMKSATSEEGPRAVLLVDALDEAEDQNGGAPKPVLQLLCRLGRVVRTEKLPISLVLTTRPEPGSNLVALQYSWTGEGQDDTSPPRFAKFSAAELHAANETDSNNPDIIVEKLDERWERVLQLHHISKIYMLIARQYAEKALHSGTGCIVPPETLDDAYRLWFDDHSKSAQTRPGGS